MLKMMAANVAMTAIAYGCEKAWIAGADGLRTFRTARAARRAQSATECLNASPEPAETILRPFKVTIGARFACDDDAIGAAVHDIFAEDANAASAWATRHYMHLDASHVRIMVEAVH